MRDPESEPTIEDLHELFQAMAGPTRLRILNLVAAGELCVCDIVEILAAPQPTISRHLITLREAGFVDVRRQGRFAYYRLADVKDDLRLSLLDTVREHLTLVQELRLDRERAEARATLRALEPCC